jgi:HPt (histidine-containing phosphotransfer) domain-containing protein
MVESPSLAAQLQSDDVVDRAALDGLRALQSAGAPGLLEKVLDSFLEDTPHQLADLRHAAQVGDAVRLTKLAHKLKGSVSNFGASRMVRVCTELETLGKNGDVGIAPQLLSDLDRQFDLASTVLRSEIAKV